LTDKETIEPVAWYDDKHLDFSRVQRVGWKPLYTTPQQRTWVGLTDEEIAEAIPLEAARPLAKFARAIEAKLKEKNT
jgi:hypothetical protein